MDEYLVSENKFILLISLHEMKSFCQISRADGLKKH